MPVSPEALRTIAKVKYIPKMIDQIFVGYPVLALLKEKIAQSDDADTIRQPVLFGRKIVEGFDGYDPILSRQSDVPAKWADYGVRNHRVPLEIARTDLQVNQGEATKVFKLTELQIENAMISMEEDMNKSIFLGDGTGAYAKKIVGLPVIVANTGTYAGINRAVDTWWQARINTATADRPITWELVRRLITAVSFGSIKPNLMVASEELWHIMVDRTDQRMVYYTPVSGASKKVVDLGFDAIHYQGVPIVWDRDCPARTLYVLNTDFLRLRYIPGAYFDMEEWRLSEGFSGIVSELYFSGNLECTQPRTQLMANRLIA
ncbi:MAG: hypothetical protein DDT40_01430 [candidate division WS2 bacterium]|nr:hypothetical protein [Candidatus Psychracetigena formicireducens]